MTPSKKGKTTVIRIEKVKKSNLDEAQVAHMAGGQHSGLVINKQIAGICISSAVPLTFGVRFTVLVSLVPFTDYAQVWNK